MSTGLLGFESVQERRGGIDSYISPSRLNCWMPTSDGCLPYCTSTLTRSMLDGSTTGPVSRVACAIIAAELAAVGRDRSTAPLALAAATVVARRGWGGSFFLGIECLVEGTTHRSGEATGFFAAWPQPFTSTGPRHNYCEASPRTHWLDSRLARPFGKFLLGSQKTRATRRKPMGGPFAFRSDHAFRRATHCGRDSFFACPPTADTPDAPGSP